MPPRGATAAMFGPPPNKKDAPVDLTESLRQVEGSMRKLLDSGLNKKAILILLAADCQLPKSTVEQVLDSASNIATRYLTKR